MKTLNINNIGKSGLNTDLAPWELPPEFITFGVNFRAYGNVIESTHAYEAIATPPVSFNAGHIMAVEVKTGNFFLVPGRSAVYLYDGGSWYDISSTEGYAGLGQDDELLWTSTMFGSIPIINNPQGYPEYWSPQTTTQPLQALNFSPTQTWLQADKSFKVLRSYKNYLFALNLVEGGIDLPNSYRWSHPADLNGLPYTWDETDLASIASIEQVLGDSGAIVDGLTLRDSFCIYSERGISMIDQGGEFIFTQRELSNSFGLISRNALAEINGVHYFIGDGDIFMNDGNSIVSILTNVIKTRFNSIANSAFYDRSYVVVNNAAKEIWFIIPEETSEYPDTVFIWNWVDQKWGIKRISQTIAFSAYGTISTAPITIDQVTGTWDSTTLKYNAKTTSPLSKAVMGVNNVDSSLVIINELAASSTINTETRVERTDLTIAGHDIVTTLTRMYPLIEGSAILDIQVGSQQFAGGPVAWKPVQKFNPATDRKIDLRTTGEYHAWRIDSFGTGRFKLSGLVFEYAIAGKR